MKPVVMGILGVSAHYNLRVSDPVRKLEEVNMAVVGSRNQQRATAAAGKWGLSRGVGSYEEVLADPEVEAVYIPLPNHLHGEWIKKCADAGKHVLCEKPIDLDADQATEALDYAEKRGILVMEAFMYRFHPQWILAKKLVDVGEIGEPRSIQTIFCFNNQDPENIRNIREYGGGALLDIGCYAVSSARFLLGREPDRVAGRIERHPTFDTDVFVSALMDFGPASAMFTVSTGLAPRQTVRVYGTGGSLTVNLPFNAYPDVPLEVTVETGVGTRSVMCGPADQYAEMFRAFAAALRSGGPVPTPPADAVANMRVLDAIVAAAETGQWQAL